MRGPVRQSRRGGKEFQGSSSQSLLSVACDLWLLQLHQASHGGPMQQCVWQAPAG